MDALLRITLAPDVLTDMSHTLLIAVLLLTAFYASEQALRAAAAALHRGDAQTGCNSGEHELGDVEQSIVQDEGSTGHEQGKPCLVSSDLLQDDDDYITSNNNMTCKLTGRLTPEILTQIAEWAVLNDELAHHQQHQQGQSRTSRNDCRGGVVVQARGRQRTSSNDGQLLNDDYGPIEPYNRSRSRSQRRQSTHSHLSALCLAQACTVTRDAVLPVIWRSIDLSSLPYRHHGTILRLLSDPHRPHRSYVRSLYITIALGNASSPSPLPLYPCTQPASTGSSSNASSYFSISPHPVQSAALNSRHLTASVAATLLSSLSNLSSLELTFSNTSQCPPFYISRLPSVLQDALEWLQKRGEIRHLGLSTTQWVAAEEEEVEVRTKTQVLREEAKNLGDADQHPQLTASTHAILPGGLLELEHGILCDEQLDVIEPQLENSVDDVASIAPLSEISAIQPQYQFPGLGQLLSGATPPAPLPLQASPDMPPTNISLPSISFPSYSYATPAAAEYAPFVQFTLDEGLASRLIDLFSATLRSLAIHRVNGDSLLPYSSLQRAIAKCRWLQRLDILDTDALCDKWRLDEQSGYTAAVQLQRLSVVNCSRLDMPTLSDILHQHCDTLKTLSLVDLGRSTPTSSHGLHNFPVMQLRLQSSSGMLVPAAETLQSAPLPCNLNNDHGVFALPCLTDVTVEAEHCEVASLDFVQRFSDATTCPSMRKFNIVRAADLDVRAFIDLLESSHLVASCNRRVQPFEQLGEINVADGALPSASEQDLACLMQVLDRRGLAGASKLRNIAV